MNGECAVPGRDGEVPVGIGANWEVWAGACPGLYTSAKNRGLGQPENFKI